MKHVKPAFLLILVFFALPVGAGGDSSDGHTHEAPAPLPVNQTLAPRAFAASEEFEVVSTLDGKTLRLYVDRFASNEPVTHATVEIDAAGVAGLRGVARETEPGTYVFDVATDLPPARHALTISIEAGDSVDLLSLTLDTSATVSTVATVPHSHGGSARTVGGIFAALLAAGMLFAFWRYKQAKKGL